jgi:hypothetical protein
MGAYPSPTVTLADPASDTCTFILGVLRRKTEERLWVCSRASPKVRFPGFLERPMCVRRHCRARRNLSNQLSDTLDTTLANICEISARTSIPITPAYLLNLCVLNSSVFAHSKTSSKAGSIPLSAPLCRVVDLLWKPHEQRLFGVYPFSRTLQFLPFFCRKFVTSCHPVCHSSHCNL